MCIFASVDIKNYKCKIMINRINLILQAKNITAKQFAEEIGIQPSGMSHILGGRNNPSLEFVTKVMRRYPEIDINWLLLGRGAMLRSENTVSAGHDLAAARQESAPTLFAMADNSAANTAAESEGQYNTLPNVPDEQQEQLPPPDLSATGDDAVRGKRSVAKVVVFYDDNT